MNTSIIPSNSKSLVALAITAAVFMLGGTSVDAAEPVVKDPGSSNFQTALPHLPAGAVPPDGAHRTSPSIATRHILIKVAAGVDESEFVGRAEAIGLRMLKRLGTTNWYTMALPPGTLATPRDMAVAAGRLSGVTAAVADPILQIADIIPPTDPFYVDDPDPGTDCDIVSDSSCSPEDLVDQWGLFQVEAESAWTVQTGSPEVIIAVLDSGIDLDHDDLWDNLWTNDAEQAGIDGVDDDGNGKIDDKRGYDFVGNNVGSPSDDPSSEDPNPDIFSLPEHQWVADSLAIPFGYRFDGDPAVGDGIDNNLEYYPLFFTMDIGVFHGTGVAGVAGMMANNINPETGVGEGMVGACWHCKIMNVRTINAEGSALGSDMVEAIYYAVNNGAHIINASWGIAPGGASPAELAPLQEAILYAVSNGVLFIAASGNGGEAGLYFPASMPETIAVGSSNWLDQRSSFSTYAQGSEILDVVAPGELIWTSGVMSAYDAWVANGWLLFPEVWAEYYRPGDDVYNGADGTSFAAPLVSGYAALILSHNPCATSDDVRQALRDNAVDIGTPGYDAQTGYGRMRMVVPDLECSTQDTPPAVVINVPSGPVSGTVEITALASDDNGVTQVEFFVGSQSIGIDIDASDGWSSSWDTTAASEGLNTATVTATDTIGQSASDSVDIMVDNVNEPPAIDISASLGTDGIILVAWNYNETVLLERDKQHSKHGWGHSLTDLGSVSGGSYSDSVDKGTYRYRISIDEGASWSDWSEPVTKAGGGGGSTGGKGGKGGGKPQR